MNEKKKYIISFIFGIIIASCIWTGFILSSFARNTNYQDLYFQSQAYNTAIGIILDERQTTITRLSEYNTELRNTNTKLEGSIRDREEAVKTAGNDIQGISDSIDKIEYIIKSLQKLEQATYSDNHN